MPSILVLGATGYLGSAICSTLLNNGHTVYGLARSQAKASTLIQSETIPVIGSVQSPEAITRILTTHPEITIVVDAAAVYGDSVTLLNLIKEAGTARLQRFNAAKIPQGVAPKLGYVYVSGMWVHGSSRAEYVSDANPLTRDTDAEVTKPVAIVGWRPEVERLVLAKETRDVLDTAIVRPACMYGRSSAIWSGPMMALHSALGQDTAKIALAPGATPIFIHVADAAAGIVTVLEKLPLISGTGMYPVFDVMGQVESMQAIMEGAALVMGFKGKVELVGAPEGDYLGDALGTSTLGDSTRLKTILGWKGPVQKGFLQGIEVYTKAWLAGFEAQKR